MGSEGYIFDTDSLIWNTCEILYIILFFYNYVLCLLF